MKETTSQQREIDELRRELQELKAMVYTKIIGEPVSAVQPKNTSRKTGWTGAYASNGSLVITLEQSSLPEGFISQSEKANWIKYGNGTQKLETVAKLVDSKLNLKFNDNWIGFYLPAKVAKALATTIRKCEIRLPEQTKAMIWMKEQRITFSLAINQ